MELLFDLINKVKTLDENQVFEEFFEKSDPAKVFVMNLNRWEQLYEQGVFADGRPTGHYAAYTLQKKRDLGHVTEHMTFRDTGKMYESFRVLPQYGSITIEADTTMPDGIDLESYGQLLGLTDENKGVLGNYMLENGLAENILEKIQVH